MTNAQLYLAIGVPSFVALIGILVNIALYIHLSTRMETRFVSADARLNQFEARLNQFEARIDARFDRLEARLEALTGKVVDIDNRVIRIEDKLGILPR